MNICIADTQVKHLSGAWVDLEFNTREDSADVGDELIFERRSFTASYAM